MMAQSLEAIAHSTGDLDPPSEDVLMAFSETAEEVADELEAIEDARS
jgi:hypothetical protein